MFEEKVVVITGSTRGIGYEVARTFAKEKAKVIIFGSKKESVDKAKERLKKENIEVDGYYPNLSDYKEIEDTINKIYTKYKRIDVLINNAGVSSDKSIEDTSVSEFERIIDLNLNAAFRMIKAVVPIMKEQKDGVILNTSSMVSIYAQSTGCAYPTSKFGINGLTKSLARELAKYNIRVNAVAPGITNTDMVSSLPKEVIEPLIKTIPLGRIGEPSDIAQAFLFLASSKASYISGVILSVDGLARS